MATNGDTPGIEHTVRKVLEEVPSVPNPRRKDVSHVVVPRASGV